MWCPARAGQHDRAGWWRSGGCAPTARCRNRWMRRMSGRTGGNRGGDGSRTGSPEGGPRHHQRGPQRRTGSLVSEPAYGRVRDAAHWGGGREARRAAARWCARSWLAPLLARPGSARTGAGEGLQRTARATTKDNKKPHRCATVRRDEVLKTRGTTLIAARHARAVERPLDCPTRHSGHHLMYLPAITRMARFLPSAAWKGVRAGCFSWACTLSQVAGEALPPTGLPHRGPLAIQLYGKTIARRRAACQGDLTPDPLPSQGRGRQKRWRLLHRGRGSLAPLPGVGRGWGRGSPQLSRRHEGMR